MKEQNESADKMCQNTGDHDNPNEWVEDATVLWRHYPKVGNAQGHLEAGDAGHIEDSAGEVDYGVVLKGCLGSQLHRQA